MKLQQMFTQRNLDTRTDIEIMGSQGLICLKKIVKKTISVKDNAFHVIEFSQHGLDDENINNRCRNKLH